MGPPDASLRFAAKLGGWFGRFGRFVAQAGVVAEWPPSILKSTNRRRLAHVGVSPLSSAALARHAHHRDGAAADNPEVLPTVPSDTSRSVTELLDAWGRGDRAALDALVPSIYALLHKQAEYALRGQPEGHTLQPTALVHEAYVRLAGQPGAGANSRAHFFAVAAMVMRSVVVDHARARQAAKRGGHAHPLTLGAAERVAVTDDAVDAVALDEALDRLAEHDPRKARVVELRYFVGLSIEETAQALDSSPTTIKREWTGARAWLRRELTTA